MNRNWIVAGLGLALFAVAGRFWPHVANLTPLYAVALFAAAVFPRGKGIWVPVAAMVASDLVIGMHDTVLFTWSGMLLFVALGSALRKQHGAGRIALAALAGSTGFFVWTNFGVWLVSGLYPPTASGLVQCYTLALPFFRNSLLGDLGFAAALFAAYELVMARRAARVAAQPAC
jgi:hypothetical protein